MESNTPKSTTSNPKSKSQTTGPISSSIANLSQSSRTLPSDKDFHFYNNFPQFRSSIDEITSKSQSMLHQIAPLPPEIELEGCDWLANVNDEIIERFDSSVGEFLASREEEEEKAPAGAVVTGKDDGKKKEENAVGVRVVERDKKTGGAKAKLPFHVHTIKRPQDEYGILVNNANQPFQHVWLERSEDGSRFIHPLEKLSVMDFVDRDIERFDPVKPPPLESTPFKLVKDTKDLKELAAKLRSVNEFAVDLEHNQYRSFQGLTCLMQISTRCEDFVVDTLKLRIHIGPYLREVFKDPAKRKVMHGADRDIIWLQRDFGIYVCNLFDTGQASRVLQMERYSLEFLLQHFCGVTANKEYQKADWRLRPLPAEMIRYAREDTHYLLHIYDLMKMRLLSESTDPGNSDVLLLEVYKRSYDVCMQIYEKELLTDTSYLNIYGVQGACLNAQQLSIVAGLCEWRDTVARAEDESTGYILPNKMLLEIAKQMPLTTSQLKRLFKSKHAYLERNLSYVVNIIRHSVQNASAFESVAELLKEGRAQVAPELIDAAADFPELHTARDYSGGSHQGYALGSVLSNNGSHKLMCHGSNFLKNRGGGLVEGIGKNGKLGKDINDSIISESRTGCFSFPSLKKDISVAQASVQVLKKPNRALGTLLGSSASRKQTVFKEEKGDNQLEQIKSAVNLPFYSFSPKDQQSKQSPKQVPERSRVSDATFSKEHPTVPDLSANSEEIILLDIDRPSNEALEDPRTSDSPVPDECLGAPTSNTYSHNEVILLDSDSDDEEQESSPAGNDNNVNTMVHQETSQVELVVLDDDDDDEEMYLSDLSSSFENCLQSTSQNQIVKQDGNSEEAVR